MTEVKSELNIEPKLQADSKSKPGLQATAKNRPKGRLETPPSDAAPSMSRPPPAFVELGDVPSRPCVVVGRKRETFWRCNNMCARTQESQWTLLLDLGLGPPSFLLRTTQGSARWASVADGSATSRCDVHGAARGCARRIRSTCMRSRSIIRPGSSTRPRRRRPDEGERENVDR